MPRTCTRESCNGAVSLVNSNGATDPSEDRLEIYECEFGHTFNVLLEGRR